MQTCLSVFEEYLDRDVGRVHYMRRHLARSAMIDAMTAIRKEVEKRLNG